MKRVGLFLLRCLLLTVICAGLPGRVPVEASDVALPYQDDFSNPNSGWTPMNEDYCQYGYQNIGQGGEYSIQVAKDNWMTWAWAPPDSFPADFAAEVEAQLMPESRWNREARCGIIWGKDEDNFYWFRFRYSYSYSLARCEGGVWKESPVPWTGTVGGVSPDKIRLRVTVRGDSVTLGLNNDVLTTVTAPSVGSVRLALAVGHGDQLFGVTHVHFDNFNVSAAPPNRSPIAQFAFLPANPAVGQSVTFVSSSYDPDGWLASWAWSFGDGSTAVMGTSPTHAYARAGAFTVTLTVTDNEGAQSSTSQTLTVQ